MKLLKIPFNEKGRDFFVGDIHGKYDMLMDKLKEVNFDYDIDRLFAVGDLVDRGIQNLECLSLLLEPWFHSVKGNHEDLLEKSCKTRLWKEEKQWRFCPWYNCHANNGGEWADDLNAKELQFCIEMCSELPLCIVIGEGPDRVNVIHAEFPRGTKDEDIDYPFRGMTAERLMWDRNIMGAPEVPPETYVTYRRGLIPGLSLTICGHTPNKVIRYRDSHLCLDTYGWGGSITVLEKPDPYKTQEQFNE